jgi:hypothetical protein
MADLKACPFCGSPATGDGRSVCCTSKDCILNGLVFRYGEDWNRRPIESALTARVAELEKQAQEPIRLCTITTDDLSKIEIGVDDEYGDEIDREVQADAVMAVFARFRTRVAELEAENERLRELVKRCAENIEGACESECTGWPACRDNHSRCKAGMILAECLLVLAPQESTDAPR